MEVERDAEIRELAYRIWQEEGYPSDTRFSIG
jgi:DUF2934 family protein